MSEPSRESLELIDRLIAFDTTSHKSNLELIRFVADYLSGFGIDAELTHDADGAKANLYATIGPTDRPGVVLSGHTDVVPVEGQDWTADPFTLRRDEGRLFGRGTSDMKSFIGAVLARVPQFATAGLKVPVHLAFSYDEEIGCVGVQSLIADLADRPMRPAACIVGEPTGMQVVTAHKGKISMRCTVTGREAHSSQAHKAANAVQGAARIVTHLADLADRSRDEGPYAAEMDPPYTTIHVGTMRGGTALNIVPKKSTFEFEIRYLPDQDPHRLVAETQSWAAEHVLGPLRAGAREADISWEPISHIVALNGSEDSAAVRLAKALTGANTTTQVAFGTEAGLFDEIAIPTVVCGPGFIDQAHQPDEFIDLEQIAMCETFLDRLTERLVSGSLD